ncbi:hypothetical protein AAF712_014818 [Marasmius tenuissimus]|uniref:FAD-binding PCMH-type domain-containing protein n=1 Tax=Marasmius tenuissimus TaxID=585030 RepID=A0ABR2ZC69_9AGAR
MPMADLVTEKTHKLRKNQKPPAHHKPSKSHKSSSKTPKTTAKPLTETKQDLTLSDWLEVFAYAEANPAIRQIDIVRYFVLAEAYAAAQQNNRLIVGGLDNSVGVAGGWVGGGGHGAFAPRYGLGIDNAIQFTVVTANGDHVTANAHSHPDLFWALRGGGPGTFGVVTSVTYKTQPIEPLVASAIRANFTSTEIAKSVGTEFFKLQPKVAESQWGGYTFYRPDSFTHILYATNVTMEEINETIEPFVKHLNSTAGENNVEVSVFPASSFYEINGKLNKPLDRPVGINVEMASRMYTKNLYETESAKMAGEFLKISSSLGVGIAHVAGGAVSQVDPDSVGLHPHWRDTPALVFIGIQWEDGASAAEIQAQKDVMKQNIDILEGLEPGRGSYVNEGSFYEPNPQRTFFGDHYNRLMEIKDQYDPSELFLVANGVGSDRWDKGLNCRRGQLQ